MAHFIMTRLPTALKVELTTRLLQTSSRPDKQAHTPLHNTFLTLIKLNIKKYTGSLAVAEP